MTPSTSVYSGYVYLLGSSQFGWYKIGKARDADVRVKTIGILLPFKIEIFAVWSTPDRSGLETEMHRRFAPHRINGEWFLFDKDKFQEVLTYQSEIPSWRIFNFWAMPVFSNPEKDSIDTNLVRFKRTVEDGKEFYRVLRSFMEDYLSENGLELTKENKKIAKNAAMTIYSQEKDRWLKRAAQI